MEIKKIRELARILNEQQLTYIEYESGEDRLILKKEHPVYAVPSVVEPVHTQVNVGDNVILTSETPSAETVKAPMVGVFYSAPSPEAEPFVKAGDKVKKGDVLCIIEAMKLMNEITAEKDMEIVRVIAENGQVVEYAQPLIEIR